VKTYTYVGLSGILLRSASPCFPLTLPGNPVHCYYCPNCTAHAYHHQTVLGDKVICRTILLDGGKSFKPVAEIFGKVRLPWSKEVAKTYEVVPP
jgi:hypothetical protein